MSAGSSNEVFVDAALVRRLVAAQFPQWADLPISPVPLSGMDNATYRLGEDMSVRLPRYPAGSARWSGSSGGCRGWPRACRCPSPCRSRWAVPAEGYPFPWSVYRWLDGETRDPDRIADPVRAAKDLAEFIAALQSLDPPAARPRVEQRLPRRAHGRRARLRCRRDAHPPQDRGAEGLVDTDAVTAVWEAALAAPPWDGPPVWIHGDPAPAICWPSTAG